jgi:hypothetical protein
MHRQNQQIELSLQITISSNRFNLAHLEINIPATTVRCSSSKQTDKRKHAEPANKSWTGGAREGREEDETEGEDYLRGGEGRARIEEEGDRWMGLCFRLVGLSLLAFQVHSLLVWIGLDVRVGHILGSTGRTRLPCSSGGPHFVLNWTTICHWHADQAKIRDLLKKKKQT